VLAPLGDGAEPPRAALVVSPTGSDGGLCTVRAPCRTFARAYRVARPGDIVDVRSGTYGPQDIPIDESKRSRNDVVFRPAPGATVTIGCPDDGKACLDILGKHVTIRGMHVTGMPPVNGYPWQGSVDTERGCDDVTLIAMDAGSFNAACSNLRILGGDWGPTIDPHNSRIVAECVNCLFDGLLIHDYAIALGGHMECITFEGGTNVTIRNSEFRSCSIFSIFAKPTDPIDGALIENNVFWNPRHFDVGNEIKFSSGSGGSCRRVVIRYNVIWNIQLSSQVTCGSGWDYNVFVNGRPCGSHSFQTARRLFVDPSHGNFRLVARSPAIGRGAPSMYPRTDRDGHRRPIGALADAGAYEAPLPKRPTR
jgi:hypothetical protein